MLRTTVVSLVLACASSLCAAWDLQPEGSTLNFVSIKKNTIGEVHRFKQLTGRIDDNGKAELTIALDSVDTAVEIRDDRMREFLFETGKYPTARYTVTVDPTLLSKLAVGEGKTVSLDGTLSLHGQSVKVPAKVSVLKTKNGRLLVSTLEPILLNAEQFGMNDGISKLMELVALPSISPVVPVTFSLQFTDTPPPAKATKP